MANCYCLPMSTRIFQDTDCPPELSPAQWAELKEARAQAAAGRLVAYEEVLNWVKSWDTPHERPMPRSEAHE